MPNQYVDLYNDGADQRLYEDLVFESINFSGISAMYMPRSSQSKFDALFGDDPTKMFKQAYPLDVYIQTVDNFEGGELFSKFGLEVRKQAKFMVSNRGFTQAMPAGFGRPLEGDILWLPNFRAFLEIKYVEDESMFYLFGKNQTKSGLYGYTLVCEKWIMAEEVVATGQSDIDSTADLKVSTYNFNMTSANSANTYLAGEKVSVFANANNYATVSSWNKPSLTLHLKHIHGSIVANDLLVGQNSNARFSVANTVKRDDINNTLDNNQLLSVQGNSVISFDEKNPFGDIIEP